MLGGTTVVVVVAALGHPPAAGEHMAKLCPELGGSG